MLVSAAVDVVADANVVAVAVAIVVAIVVDQTEPSCYVTRAHGGKDGSQRAWLIPIFSFHARNDFKIFRVLVERQMRTHL